MLLEFLFGIAAGIEQSHDEDRKELMRLYNAGNDGEFGRDDYTMSLYQRAARYYLEKHRKDIKNKRTSEVEREYSSLVSKRYAEKLLDGSANEFTLM